MSIITTVNYIYLSSIFDRNTALHIEINFHNKVLVHYIRNFVRCYIVLKMFVCMGFYKLE
jgi:hypothetical protein